MKKVLMYALAIATIATLALTGCSLFGGPETTVNYDEDFAILDFDLNGDGTTDVEEVLDDAGGKVATYVDEDGAAAQVDGKYLRVVSGTWTKDLKFTADSIWFLDGSVFIGDDSYDTDGDGDYDATDEAALTADGDPTAPTLTIAAGTTVKGLVSPTTPGTLVITRGANIEAVGTASSPIVFTSARAEGSRAAGDWGGLVINGFARVQKGTAQGEGSTGTYGGNDDADSSGTIKYVRVEFAGTLFSPDNELNGIAFQGVGGGTTVDYVQVHQNADDGVEFFGGSVRVSHLVLTGNQDDSLDHDDGWNGSAQYVVIQQYPNCDHGIEGDGDSTDVFPPVSAYLANFTYIGNAGTDDGFKFRRDAAPSVYNSLITYVADGENAIDEESESDDTPPSDESAGTVTYAGVVVTSAVEDSTEVDWADGSNGNALLSSDADANLPTGAYATLDDGVWSFAAKPTAAPTSGTAQTIPATDPHGSAMDSAGSSFIGAIDPAGTDWTTGWTAFPEN